MTISDELYKNTREPKVELEYVLTKFLKLKAFPRESAANFILRLETTSETIITPDYKELPKDSFI